MYLFHLQYGSIKLNIIADTVGQARNKVSELLQSDITPHKLYVDSVEEVKEGLING